MINIADTDAFKGSVYREGLLQKRAAELEGAGRQLMAELEQNMCTCPTCVPHRLNEAVNAMGQVLKGGAIVFPSALGKTTNLLK
jgi:hypothetical protein